MTNDETPEPLEAAPVTVSWSALSAALGRLMPELHGEWCGVPIPVEGFTLDIESKNPWRDRLLAVGAVMFPPPPLDPDEVTVELVNSWYSYSKRAWVYVYRQDGRTHACVTQHDAAVRTRFTLDTVGIAQVWNLQAEYTALERLRELIKPHLWEAYMLTGTFLESSRRSGLFYLFRRLRPTVVLTPHKDVTSMAVLTTLCLHPIGYYGGTFAGSMVPTDEVIAHLMLLRGDEHLYWRRANQHPVSRPESGL